MASSHQQIQKFDVLGVAVCGMNLRLATEAILQACAEKKKGYVCVTGVHGITEAQNDEGFRAILNGAFLNTTDGMPLVWLGMSKVGSWVSRVYGPDLMLEVFEATKVGQATHFFYGGAPGVAEDLKAALVNRFPGVQVVGTYCPPFRPLTPEEENDLEKQFTALKPDIVWVGLSTPKQERFMSQYLERLDCTVMLGVGAAFDFHSGRIKQAPRWIQRSGFEWLYRVFRDPKRLWKRYFINNPLFLGRLFLQATGLRKYPIEKSSSENNR